MATTPTPRIYSAAQLQRGPSDLWLKLTAPADGTHIITLASDGTPDATTNPNAVHCGLLAVPSVLTYTPKPDFESVDQDMAPIAAFSNTEEVVIEATMSQLAFNKVLQHCMPAGAFSDSAKEGITLGQGGDILLTPSCIAVIAPSSDPAYKWTVALLYKAVPASAVKIEIGRSKTASYQVQFKGLSDLTRTAGDRVGSVYKTN